MSAAAGDKQRRAPQGSTDRNRDLDEVVAHMVAQFPPLTEQQKAELSRLLTPGL